jgi:N-carbamoyl-L-amino-acid hydrolase
MDAELQGQLARGARELGIDAMALPSGAGHDAQDFAHAGFPAAMIFVRNAHGSHNPREALDPSDLGLGTELLTRFLVS